VWAFIRQIRHRTPLLVIVAMFGVAGLAGVASARHAMSSAQNRASTTGLSIDGSAPHSASDDDPHRTADLAGAAAAANGPRATGSIRLADAHGIGIDPVVLAAHRQSAQTTARTTPNCHLHWSLLAGIGQVESGNARSRTVRVNGDTAPHILGPVLDGGGFAAIRDTDSGRYDGNTVWDRAVGAMQFIPSSWRRWASDGNKDGQRDPNNVFDESLGAAGYLCNGHDLAVPAQLGLAIYSYNHSWDYVRTVLSWVLTFRTGQPRSQPGSAVGVPAAVASAPAALGTADVPRRGTTTPTRSNPGRPSPLPSRTQTASSSPSPCPSPTPSATASPLPSLSGSASPSPGGSCPASGSPTPSPTVSPSP
jgi:hypothetical protein